MSAVTFEGYTEFRPSAIPAFAGGGYELDTCRVPWRGRAPYKQAFVDGLPRFQALAGFAGDFANDGSDFHGYAYMFLDSVSDDQAAVFPTVDLNYVGFKLGPAGVPPPRAEDSLVESPISVTNLTGPGGLGPITFFGTYKSPRTKWTWYAPSNPNRVTPAYSGVRSTVSLLASLDNLRTPENVAVPAALAARYLAPLRTRIITMDCVVTDSVPGSIWSCSCVSQKEFTY